jgi:hypothetical protein
MGENKEGARPQDQHRIYQEPRTEKKDPADRILLCMW